MVTSGVIAGQKIACLHIWRGIEKLEHCSLLTRMWKDTLDYSLFTCLSLFLHIYPKEMIIHIYKNIYTSEIFSIKKIYT